MMVALVKPQPKDNLNISYRESLSEQNTDNEKYTLVLANPPFKGSLDYEAVEHPPTSEILANIEATEVEIAKEMAELKKLLGE